MKWYWIVLIIAVILIITYFIIKRKNQIQQIQSCRQGTCPYVRADGTIFCTSAACQKSTDTAKTVIVTPTRSVFQGIVGGKNYGGNGVSVNAAVGR